MVFNGAFNNISNISWWPVLLVEETGEPGETTDLSLVTDKHYHIKLYGVYFAVNWVKTHNFSGDRQMIAQIVVNPTAIQSRRTL